MENKKNIKISMQDTRYSFDASNKYKTHCNGTQTTETSNTAF